MRDSLGANRYCSCNERSANLKKARKLSVTSTLELFSASSCVGNMSAFERCTLTHSLPRRCFCRRLGASNLRLTMRWVTLASGSRLAIVIRLV